MNDLLRQMFSNDDFGLFFSLSLFIFGGIIIARYYRLLRALMKKKSASGKDKKKIMRISGYMNTKKEFWDMKSPVDAGNPVKSMYKKGVLKEQQLPDVAVAIGMLAGGTLILVGIIIFVVWLIR